jgi:hypothetical protein
LSNCFVKKKDGPKTVISILVVEMMMVVFRHQNF